MSGHFAACPLHLESRHWAMQPLLETRDNGRGIIYYVGFVLIILGARRDTVIVD